MSEPVKLPTGWMWASLADLLTSIETGKSFKCEERPPQAEEVGVVKVSAVSWGEYREQESKTCLDEQRINPDLFVKSGDFLFSRANTQELVGACVIAGKTSLRVMLSDKILRFNFAKEAMKPWLLRYLGSFAGRSQIESLASGNQDSMRNIGQVNIGRIQVPIAPRAEQTRIVAKLEELLSDLDAGVAELKAAQKKLKQYRQSLLKAAVEGALTADWRAKNTPSETGAQLLTRILTERRARWEAKQLAKFAEQGKTPPKDWQKKYPEPVQPDTTGLPALPQGWVWASVDQLAESVRNGLSKTPNTEGKGFPIFKINAVRPMAVNFSAIKHIELSEADAADYWVEVGDVLATRYNGSVDLLGVFGLVKKFSQQTLYPDKLIRMKPVLGGVAGSWLEMCGNVGFSRAHLVSRVKTTAGQTGISGNDLKKTPIPLPPVDEQTEILECVGAGLEHMAYLELPIEHSLRQSAAQRQNILRAAFAGQLVPQDPADEPASVLLERIRAERAAQNAAKPARGRKPKVQPNA
ncbi:restriction endonuclease subunit S [Rivihabitans pingtungensis]|uniref:restriction endonuclease subunit S n=1 Tax=Rivihabitans pingtungensis TaxID=1054498 RepID=UPI0028965B43|nr:hypothetical protein [Rivihabitans pingtungensis]